jgi:hypothetical protein
VLAGETVMVVMLKVNGATDRAGGALTWGEYTLTQASTTQKAAASPEASTELWYLLNHRVASQTLTIPNSGALTVFYQVAFGRAAGGGKSKFNAAVGTNNTSANPSPGAIAGCLAGDIVFSTCASGATTWAPSAQSGTVIQNTDDGAHGGGTEYSLRASDGSFTPSWTQASDDWGAVAAAFSEIPPNRFENYKRVRADSGISVSVG